MKIVEDHLIGCNKFKQVGIEINKALYSACLKRAKRCDSSSCSWDTCVEAPIDVAGPDGSSILSSKLK